MQNYKENRKQTVVTESVPVCSMLSINVKLLELKFRHQNIFFFEYYDKFYLKKKTKKNNCEKVCPSEFIPFF